MGDRVMIRKLCEDAVKSKVVWGTGRMSKHMYLQRVGLQLLVMLVSKFKNSWARGYNKGVKIARGWKKMEVLDCSMIFSNKDPFENIS